MAHRIAIHTDGRNVQGNERQIELIARGLIGRGHDVHISARPHSPAWALLSATGAHMSAARPRGAGDIVSALRFAWWLRRVRPDALLFTSWRRLWIAGLVARMARVPNVVMRFGGRHGIPQGWRGAHYRQALLRFVDRIYANSAGVREHLVATLPDLDPQRVHLVWNAVPGHEAAPAPLREQLGITAQAPIIAAVGGLARRKGFDTLLHALSQIDSAAHVVIAGEGAERAALCDLARSPQIAGRVHLIGQRDDVPGVLAAADVFVLSSRAEGFSVALLEAMRAGLPIIATDVGGVRDALCDDRGRERAGWVVPPDDPSGLAAALQHVLRSLAADETRARTAEARRRAREDFTIERMIDGVERVLLGGRP
ncbi:MAG: glycosyltransferase [Longimicrobiales bacterium]